ncbi:hypothetical protein EIMP300_63740 [Escherichia coli]|uniref:Luciferase-like domain-containing protein n=1 Tax=Escherichia coli TaxID=562 RepID=A0A8S0FW08_ECOLX|nr:hypothetical protein EIMP300_63740 [Escherichia coli]
MSLNMFWFLPTHGDGHYLGTEEGSRPVDHGYLQQIAQAADRLGYTGVLIPTGRSCEDAWLVAASMIPVTQRLKFLVALRPSVTSPTVAARQAATLDRLSNGRALFNLVTGSDPQELAGDGVFLDHSERYEASAEFTQVWRRLLLGEIPKRMLWISTANIFMYAGPNCSSRRFNSLILRFTLADRQMSPRSWRQNKLISTLPGANHRNW